MNKTATFNDAIIFLSKDSDPLFGSISYHKPVNPNSIITITSGTNKAVKLPLAKIVLAIFKLDSLRYGLIYKSGLYFDRDVSYWDKQTKLIASHTLEANFHPNLKALVQN